MTQTVTEQKNITVNSVKIFAKKSNWICFPKLFTEGSVLNTSTVEAACWDGSLWVRLEVIILP